MYVLCICVCSSVRVSYILDISGVGVSVSVSCPVSVSESVFHRSWDRTLKQTNPLQVPTMVYLLLIRRPPSRVLDNGFSSKRCTEQQCRKQGERYLRLPVLMCDVNKMGVSLGDLWRCNFMKAGSMMMEFQDLQMHLNRMRRFTGSHERISATSSWGRTPWYRARAMTDYRRFWILDQYIHTKP